VSVENPFRSPSFLISLLLGIGIVFFRFLIPPLHILSWDVFGYYLYLPATFIYHDPGIHDLSWVKQIADAYQTSDTLYQLYPAPSGGWVIKYSLGIALLTLPAFFLGHLYALATGFPADGFSLPYQYAFAISGLVFAVTGIFMLRKILREFFSETVTSIVLVIIVLGTNYFQLTAFEGMLSHNYLFTLYTFIVWFTLRWHREPKASTAAWLGLFLGLAILSRPSELVCLLIPLLWGIYNRDSLRHKLKLISEHPGHLLLLAGLMLLTGLPQLIYWKQVTGHWLYYSYNNPGEGFDFFRPYTWQVLFSSRKGWLIYTPVMIFALAGFRTLYRKQPELLPAILTYFVINLWVVSSWTCWWYAGGSYSQRGLLPSYVLLAIPLGYFIDAAFSRKKSYRGILLAVCTALLLLNLFQTWQWVNGILDKTRMTREYYFAIFGRTTVSESDKKLLLVERGSVDVIPENKEHLKYRLLVINDYEAITENGSDTSYSGKRSCRLPPQAPYAAGTDLPYNQLTQQDYAWIRVSAMIYPLGPLAEPSASLVASFEHKGEPYKYTAESVGKEKYHVVPGQWNPVSLDFLTPEFRSRDDRLKVYFWLQGSSPMLIDDLKVEMWEPKK